MLRPLPPETIVVQVTGTLTAAEFSRLNELLLGSPAVEFRVFAEYGDEGPADLDFLRHMPGLRSLHVGLPEVRDIQGLAVVADSLVSLRLGRVTRKTSLMPLAGFTVLEEFACGGAFTDFETIADLESLREIAVVAVAMPMLAALSFRGRIEVLSLFGPLKQTVLELPEGMRGLRFLEVERDTRLADIGAVAELPELELLALDCLPAVTGLPDLSALTRLERLEIFNLKRLADLRALRSAPALREVVVSRVPVPAAAVVDALAGTAVRAATITPDRSVRRFPLPEVGGTSRWRIPRIRRPAS
ncbi:hypothetical protein GCM10009828_077830 [Actinoplanes couchii]|uniref:Leucine-rich repeat domain-containing protein n=2 Tax=Actinoplanes couchii TaxID=403638 RepID=A0ABQ3XF78_9ACTN|nr:hypothetical protein Aco03nite_055660 [Actinoplanes couchii]